MPTWPLDGSPVQTAADDWPAGGSVAGARYAPSTVFTGAGRAACSTCAATHVLEPASTVARHRDTAEVIGAAWSAKVGGAGHRRIAVNLGRPVSTVRGWLRRLSARAETLRVAATSWVHDLDPNAGPINPAGSPLADALQAVGVAVAVAAAARRFGPRAPWETAVAITGGLLGVRGPRRRGGVKGSREAVP